MIDSLQIQQLKIRYKASLREKSEAIGDRMKALSEDSQPRDLDLIETREFLHKLAGSSGMYGYDDIAATAREAMQDIQQGSMSVLLEKLTYLRSLLEQYT